MIRAQGFDNGVKRLGRVCPSATDELCDLGHLQPSLRLRQLREMGMTSPTQMLLFLTGRERGQKPARRPLQGRGAGASHYALHLTLFSSRPEASSAPHPDQVGSPHHHHFPPFSRARPPPHRAGTAAEGASSPPGVGLQKTPPSPPSWKRARGLRRGDGSTE